MGRRGPKSAIEQATIRPIRRDTSFVLPSTGADLPPPPAHLQAATKVWWKAIVADFDFEPHLLQTLQATAEAWDRKEQAREALAKHGLTYTDDKGMVRARPEVAIERDARTAYMRGMRELELRTDPAPLRKPWD